MQGVWLVVCGQPVDGRPPSPLLTHKAYAVFEYGMQNIIAICDVAASNSDRLQPTGLVKCSVVKRSAV